jgi:hypothetical protein
MTYYLLIALAPNSLTESIYEIPGWNPNDTLVFPYIKTSKTIEVGYKDFGTIENWYNYGYKVERDFKFIRSNIIKIVNSTGWVNLSLTEKQIAADYFACSQANQNEIYGIDQQINNGNSFHLKSTESRKLRISKVISQLKNRLTKEECEVILNEVVGVNFLLSKYIDFGEEGTLEGDSEGLFDYIESRPGTLYEFTGFINKSYIPVGFDSMFSFSTFLMLTLKHGDYTSHL